MFSSRARLIGQLFAFVALMLLVDGAFRAYERTRFIPARKVLAAVAAGNHCLVFSGGSDLQSALDLPTIERHWAGEHAPCLVDLALGGASPDVRFMAFRKYLSEARQPSEVVLGFKGYEIANEPELKPGYYLGTNAAAYQWGTFADLGTYYPELSFAALDNSLRFLLFRATAIGAHRQSIWLKLEQLQQRLGLVPKTATNAFGNVQAFLELEAELRTAAAASQVTSARTYRVTTWTARLIDAARKAGTERISFVRLPAKSAAEHAYFADRASEARFDRFVAEVAREHGGKYVSLAHAPWMQDELLVDGLHYSPQGAELISEDLGRALAPR